MLQPLSQEEIQTLLEGQQDILTPLAAKEDHFLKRVPCPRCNGLGHSAKVNPDNPFTPGEALPNMVLTCVCGVEFDPYTRLIRRVPTGESG